MRDKTWDDIESMDITEGGKLIGHCRLHTIEYMKAHPDPIRTPELIAALVDDAERVGIPPSRGSCTKREGYMVAITSLRQVRLIETSTDYYMWWHEHAPEGKEYRGHVKA